jgi:hypothetical protein
MLLKNSENNHHAQGGNEPRLPQGVAGLTLAARTTLERACSGYDPQFERALTEALVETIGLSSICTDAPVMSLRSAETASALLTCLSAVLATNPDFDTPSKLRLEAEAISKTIRRKVAKARAEGTFDILGAAKGGAA